MQAKSNKKTGGRKAARNYEVPVYKKPKSDFKELIEQAKTHAKKSAALRETTRSRIARARQSTAG